jgi:hypothetical protein
VTENNINSAEITKNRLTVCSLKSKIKGYITTRLNEPNEIVKIYNTSHIYKGQQEKGKLCHLKN